jgi:hypothetical protein
MAAKAAVVKRHKGEETWQKGHNEVHVYFNSAFRLMHNGQGLP